MPRLTIARLRRAGRRETYGVDVAAALNLVGALLKYLSLAFLFPVAVALWYDEPVWPFLVSGAITAGFGIGLEALTRGKEHVGTREGFLVVALTWLLAAAVGSLPYLLGDDQLSRPVDALFEGMSGFTTTGSSVVVDIPALDKSMAMWRQFTQWLGGMGIIVLALAVLPRLRVGGRQLFESEAPGPEIEKLTTKIRDTARRLWFLYVGLTALMIGTLTGFGATGIDDEMDLFEATAHAFGVLPTGGFSTQARSFEEFAAASQWVAIVFMTLAGANFALLFAAFVRGRPHVLARDEEFRLYVGLLVLGSGILLAELRTEDLYRGEEAVRHSIFQAVSTMTTTGAASADFNTWGFLAAVTLVGLMFFGGSAGSTAGSIKVVRHVIVGRTLRRELDQTVHPEAVLAVRYNGRVVDDRAVRGVITFVLLYMGLFAVGALALMIDGAFHGPEVTPLQAIAAAATTIGNVGPAFGFAGPMGSFEQFSDVSTVIMTMLMWLGRLEIIPVVVLLTRAYWRA
jgi:trk system potassium uptake protein TrkH